MTGLLVSGCMDATAGVSRSDGNDDGSDTTIPTDTESEGQRSERAERQSLGYFELRVQQRDEVVDLREVPSSQRDAVEEGSVRPPESAVKERGIAFSGTAVLWQDGGQLELELRPSDMRLAWPTFTVDSAAFYDLPPVRVPVEITSFEPGGALRSGPAAIVLGANLTRPLSDSLPSDSRAGNVVDADRDGHPGVTVWIDGHDAYVVMRVSFQLRGSVTGTDVFSGSRASVGIELVVLGDARWGVDVAGNEAEREANTILMSRTESFVLQHPEQRPAPPDPYYHARGCDCDVSTRCENACFCQPEDQCQSQD